MYSVNELAYCYPGIRSTLNRMGFVFDNGTEYGESFLKACRRHKGTVLELGTGFRGFACEALDSGVEVYLNDLDTEHLNLIASKVDDSKRERLRLAPGKFPNALEFKEESFDSIYCSNMFHFLSCDEFTRGVSKIFDWLKPKGCVYLITGSPFVPMLDPFLSTYYERKAAKQKFPGYIEDLSILDHDWVPNLPKSMLFIEIDELEHMFREAGFKIAKTSYINRDDFPRHMRMDGRENVGIIACKQ